MDAHSECGLTFEAFMSSGMGLEKGCGPDPKEALVTGDEELETTGP